MPEYIPFGDEWKNHVARRLPKSTLVEMLAKASSQNKSHLQLKKKLETLLAAHTKKAVVSCGENCMCWEIESLLADLDEQEYQRAQQKMQRTAGTVRQNGGSKRKANTAKSAVSPSSR